MPKVDPSERVYAIGDVHGQNGLLEAMLDRILEDRKGTEDHRRTRVILLGDYVDRGDASREVLETIQKLLRDGMPVTALLGNHEEALLNFLHDPIGAREWLQMGGMQTLASFGLQLTARQLEIADLHIVHDEFRQAFSPFTNMVRSMPVLSTSGDVVFAHAGVNPRKGIEEQSRRALLWGHPEGRADDPIPGKRIVHGHFDDFQIIDRPGRICIDTGAYYSGVLSAVRLDEGQDFFQVGLRDLR